MQSDASNPFASAAADGFAAWWSGPRQAIHQWLQKHSPPLAELYLGANQLLCEPRPGWTRFVAHAMREIVNRLPAAICGEENVKGHLEYGQRVEAVAAILEKHGAGSGLVEPEIDTGGTGLVSVPMSLVTELDQLVQDHRDAGARTRERALAMLRSLAPESQAEETRLRWTARTWADVGAWAVKELHDQTRTDDERDAAGPSSDSHVARTPSCRPYRGLFHSSR